MTTRCSGNAVLLALLGVLLMAPAAGAQDELFVANRGNNSVTVFGRTANGAAIPLRAISGAATGLSGPNAVIVDATNDEVLVANGSGTVTVYGRTASGNVAPLRTIGGPATDLIGPIGLALDPTNSELFVADFTNGSVNVYGRTANGNVAPLRKLTGLMAPRAVVLDLKNSEMFVALLTTDSVSVFGRTASGNAAPLRTISGAATGLNVPVDVAVDATNNELFVANFATGSPIGSVTVYGRTANGNAAPLRTIAGLSTGSIRPRALALDLANNELVVGNFGNSVAVHSRTANGNVSPLRLIVGGGVDDAEGVALSFGCLAPPAGLVGWWPMDEGAGAPSFQDIIGGSNAAASFPVGVAQGPQPIPGVVQNGARFPTFANAVSTAIVTTQTTALANVGAGDFTVDAWVNVPPGGQPGQHHNIVNRLSNGKGFALHVVSPGVPGNERLEFTWGDGTNLSTVQTISALTTGQWHHVAVTFARNVGGAALDIRLYVDGLQQGQQTGNPPGLGSLVNFVFLYFGAAFGEAPIDLDELQVFDVALSAGQIQAIYSAGSSGKCKCTTGGQSLDMTATGGGGPLGGVGQGTPATVSNPVTINYAVHGCAGKDLFIIAIVNAPPTVMPPSYFNGVAWVPVPTPLSAITPYTSGPPDGTHQLFSGSLPAGSYDIYLVCDLFVNHHLDVNSSSCLSGAFDRLPLTVQ